MHAPHARTPARTHTHAHARTRPPARLLHDVINLPGRDASGYSALHYASSAGRYSVAEMLVDNNADINIVNSSKGETPLHCAAHGANRAIVDMLLSHPEIINSINSKTKGKEVTPLHCVAASPGAEAAAVAAALLQHGAIVDAQDAAGSTPLLYCCRRGSNAALVQLLVQAGGNGNAIEHGKVSCLHLVRDYDLQSTKQTHTLTKKKEHEKSLCYMYKKILIEEKNTDAYCAKGGGST